MSKAMTIIRALDISLASVAVVVLSPVMIAIALAIKCGDRGPILFRQTRVGRNGRPFVILKFRSMYVQGADAASRQGAVDGVDVANARSRFKTTVRNDPRVTPTGRFLRSSHIDELPQLFNVLLGDMSLVGVRPDTPSQEADYPPAYWITRHALRPGITGSAQIGSSEGGLTARTALELQWLNHPSVKNYFNILMRTVGKVAKRSSF